MEKKNGMMVFYGCVMFVAFLFLVLLQFYPELFSLDNKTKGILKIVLGSLGFFVVGLWERERKKNKGDLN